jgi:ribosomal protein S18 acetylase RimI-like enzyme
MAEELTVRPAVSGDARTAAALIILPMGAFAEYLFGSGDPETIVAELFARPGNRFSHTYTDVVEAGDKVTGVLVSYPGRIMGRLGLSMGWQLLSIYGPRGFAGFVRRSLPLARAREAEAEEYFINTVAVLPAYQGQGAGSCLMTYAEDKARAMEYSKCALSVDVSNLQARRFYERRGYRTVETIRLDWKNRFSGYESYHRMVKTI